MILRLLGKDSKILKICGKIAPLRRDSANQDLELLDDDFDKHEYHGDTTVSIIIALGLRFFFLL
jgi:hypothetical protein